jgi:hypothetical protein
LAGQLAFGDDTHEGFAWKGRVEHSGSGVIVIAGQLTRSMAKEMHLTILSRQTALRVAHFNPCANSRWPGKHEA